jgi:hypothetical protein
MVNRTPGALVTSVTDIGIHDAVMESGSPAMTGLFYADSSWSSIDRFSMSGMYINAGYAEFWKVPATFTLISGSIVGNHLLNCATFTLEPTAAMSLQMAAQQLDANVVLTSNGASSTVSMIGVEIVGNVTLAGVWRSLTIAGGTITGTLTNTTTGNVNILVPNQTNSVTSDLNIGHNAAASAVDLRLNAAAGQVRALHFQSAGVDRLTFGLTAGNNVALTTYDATGVSLGSAMVVNTITGRPQFINPIDGPVTIGHDTFAAALDIKLNAAADQVRAIHFQSAGIDRLALGLTAGNNVALSIYDAGGVLVGSALAVSTATGVPSLPMGVALPLTGAPASATAAGTAGEIRIDTGFIYVCTAANTWKRVAVATW